jgi:hypothetical protein
MGLIKSIIDIPLSIFTLFLFFIVVPLLWLGNKIGNFAENLPCSMAKEFKGDLEQDIRIKLK